MNIILDLCPFLLILTKNLITLHLVQFLNSLTREPGAGEAEVKAGGPGLGFPS